MDHRASICGGGGMGGHMLWVKGMRHGKGHKTGHAVLRRSPNCKSPNKSKLHGRVREGDAECVACELQICMEEIAVHRRACRG